MQQFALLSLDGDGLCIGGHRGMGANVIRDGALAPAWRENTLRSFQAAAASGAAFVEFDVQVTRDGVPVVWHDDHVEYGDPAAPTQCLVADLTAAEFQALGALSSSGGACQQLSVVRRFKHAASPSVGGGSSAASSVVSGASPTPSPPGSPAPPQRQRWRCEADDAFPTLEQLFAALPPSLAFNIEVKMATPDSLAATPREEIDRMVKPILDVVARCTTATPAPCDGSDGGGGSSGRPSPRAVVFSSFDPDVCRALRAAQDAHPVMFLSTGGRDWHADARRTSLGAAVAEAVDARLSGVVVDSGALAASPDAAAAARAAGLRLLTYGLENDSPAWVLEQRRLGVAGVIVDDLAGLTRALGAGGGAAAAAVSAVTAAQPAGEHAAAGGEAASAAAAAAAAVTAIAGQVAAAAAAQGLQGPTPAGAVVRARS